MAAEQQQQQLRCSSPGAPACSFSSNSSEGRAPVDGVQLTLLCARALAALAAFSLTCAAVLGGAGFWHWRQLHQRPDLWPAAVAVPLVAELLFAWAWVAKYRRLNKQPPQHKPKHPSFHPRQAFDKFVVEQHKTSRWICIQKMLRSWFGDVPFESICLGNVAELITYGFWYMSREEYEAVHGVPAELLARELEQAWRVRFTPGYNPDLGFMAHLWQPVRAHYRPLAFYLAIELVFLLKHALMLAMGFTAGSVHGFTYYVYVPADPMAAQRVPLLFQHGVGVGLLPYALFVARLACMGRPVAALECAHLGMRWVPHVPCADEVVAAMAALMRERLGWARACVAGHSYGTFYASRLLQLHPALVDSICLMDPVTCGMFTGKLISNFVYTPGGATGNLVTWFVARDIHHAASVCRNFFWSCLNLWPDQLPARSLMVLSDADELVPVRELLAMVEHEAPHVRLLHHPNHQHADFLFDLPWQRQITRQLAAMLDSDPGSASGNDNSNNNLGSRANTPPAHGFLAQPLLVPGGSPPPMQLGTTHYLRPQQAAAAAFAAMQGLPGMPASPEPRSDPHAHELPAAAMRPATGPVARRRRRSSSGANAGAPSGHAAAHPHCASAPAAAAAAVPFGDLPVALPYAGQEELAVQQREEGGARTLRRSSRSHLAATGTPGGTPAKHAGTPGSTPGKRSGGHDRSDSASSYEAVVMTRLRPMPHRVAKLLQQSPQPAAQPAVQ